MTTIDRDETRRQAQGALDAERRAAIGPFTFNKARPVLAPREVLALLDDVDQAERRATRAEAQSETRRQQSKYWQERAEGFEARIKAVNSDLDEWAMVDPERFNADDAPDILDSIRRALDAP